MADVEHQSDCHSWRRLSSRKLTSMSAIIAFHIRRQRPTFLEHRHMSCGEFKSTTGEHLIPRSCESWNAEAFYTFAGRAAKS